MSQCGQSCCFSSTLSRYTKLCPVDKQQNVVYRFRSPSRTKNSSLPSLTRCRRVSSPWNNRPLHFRPTSRDLERGIRKDMQGPSVMLTGPIHTQSLHRLPYISSSPQVMCHRSTVARPLRPRLSPQWMQTQTQKQTLLSHCVRGRLCSSPPLLDACVNLEGGSDFYQTTEIL